MLPVDSEYSEEFISPAHPTRDLCLTLRETISDNEALLNIKEDLAPDLSRTFLEEPHKCSGNVEDVKACTVSSPGFHVSHD